MIARLGLKRAYEPPDPGDGLRVLVDRLWPRGLSRRDAQIVLWAREVAPSTALRRWFAHDPVKWPAFRLRYQEELAENAVALELLRQRIGEGPATLIFAAHDLERNNAVVLREFLELSSGEGA